MRFARGRKANTVDLIMDSFAEGMNISAVEHMHPEYGLVRGALYIENYEISPWGDLVKRPDGSRVNLRDPDTVQTISERCLRLLPFYRTNASMEMVLVTPTRLFKVNPYATIALEEITLEDGSSPFSESVRPGWVDYEVYQDKLYISTGNNYLVEWNGRDSARTVSDGWPEGYRFPSAIRRHLGRLFVTGFTDLEDSRAQSQLRWTELADVDTLSEDILEVRTMDDDSPLALASLQSGLATTDQAGARATACLLVMKRRNVLAATGNDWAGLTDIELHPHTPGVGCVGPAAWCWGQKGLYFASDWGIYRVQSLQPAECISNAIAPMFGRELAHADVVHPRVKKERLRETVLWSDPEKKQVFVHLPVHPVSA